MKKGICCAGNMIVDITYPIETWPKQNELTHITEGITRSTGGSPDMTRRAILSCRKWANTKTSIAP